MDFDKLTYEYTFNSQEHFIETSFTNDGVTAENTVIDSPSFKGSFITYSNGIKILVSTDMSKGLVTYYTNYPLKEISPNKFIFDIS